MGALGHQPAYEQHGLAVQPWTEPQPNPPIGQDGKGSLPVTCNPRAIRRYGWPRPRAASIAGLAVA
jgi:hypothetical protein